MHLYEFFLDWTNSEGEPPPSGVFVDVRELPCHGTEPCEYCKNCFSLKILKGALYTNNAMLIFVVCIGLEI